jgi:hypothetical protein
VSCNGSVHFGAGVLWASTRTVHTLSGFGTRGVFWSGRSTAALFGYPFLSFCFPSPFPLGYPSSLLVNCHYRLYMFFSVVTVSLDSWIGGNLLGTKGSGAENRAI